MPPIGRPIHHDGSTKMPGPPKTPTALKLLHGSRERAKSEAPLAPAPRVVVVPEAPTWLSDDARAEWDRLAPGLAQIGLLTEFDVSALGIYCAAYGRLCVAERELRREEIEFDGAIMVPAKDDDTGKVKSRWLAIARHEAEAANRYLQAFGLSPESRKKVIGLSGKPAEGNPEDEARWSHFKRG